MKLIIPKDEEDKAVAWALEHAGWADDEGCSFYRHSSYRENHGFCGCSNCLIVALTQRIRRLEEEDTKP